MTIKCPNPQWPTGLLAVGPKDDPTILLRSIADIDGAPYLVMAIRIDPIRLCADLRTDLPRRTYADCPVAEMLDDLGSYTEITNRSLVHLSTGAYVIVMMPGSGSSEDGNG
jgi:hypothetical protein